MRASGTRRQILGEFQIWSQNLEQVCTCKNDENGCQIRMIGNYDIRIYPMGDSRLHYLQAVSTSPQCTWFRQASFPLELKRMPRDWIKMAKVRTVIYGLCHTDYRRVEVWDNAGFVPLSIQGIALWISACKYVNIPAFKYLSFNTIAMLWIESSLA